MLVYTGQNRYRFLLTLIFILLFLLILAPSVNLLVDTLAKGKASHTLLQRRSAPRKVVRVLPDKRGPLADCILSFISRHAGTFFLFDPFLYFLFFSYKKPDFFFPGKLK